MYQKLKSLPELAALPLLICVGLLFFAATSPESLPPAMLIFGFAILVGILYCTVRLITVLLGVKARVSPRQYKGILVSATLLPVMLLALQSLGQLTVRDTITLMVLFAAGYFYISRTRRVQ